MRLKAVLIVVCLCMLSSPALATNYYVKQGATGTTCLMEDPCGDLTIGISDLSNGDIPVVGGWTYTNPGSITAAT